MDEIKIPETRSNGIESPAGFPIRDINSKSDLDGIGAEIDRPEEDGPVKAPTILNNSLIPSFGSIENYERLRRIYPNGIPASEIATGC